MTSARRVLVAGLGNVFLGDDGFGVEVVRRLAERPLPPGVEVADIGIRGVHLAFELLDGVEQLILVDAARRGDPPGTVSVIEVDGPGGTDADRADAGSAAADGFVPLMDAHDMGPDAVLGLLGALGGHVGRPTIVVTCEPERLEPGMGLSGPVADAVEPAADAVLARLPYDEDVDRNQRDQSEQEASPCW